MSNIYTDPNGLSANEPGLYDAAHAAWNALARLELMLRENK